MSDTPALATAAAPADLAAQVAAINAMNTNGLLQRMQIEITEVTPQRIVATMPVEGNTQPYGLLHGGAIYTLADNATGAAACSDGRYYVTQTSSLHFLRNVAEGTVYATATIRHRGRATCLTSVDITTETGKLLATGEFTFFCVDKGVMDQKRDER